MSPVFRSRCRTDGGEESAVIFAAVRCVCPITNIQVILWHRSKKSKAKRMKFYGSTLVKGQCVYVSISQLDGVHGVFLCSWILMCHCDLGRDELSDIDGCHKPVKRVETCGWEVCRAASFHSPAAAFSGTLEAVGCPWAETYVCWHPAEIPTNCQETFTALSNKDVTTSDILFSSVWADWASHQLILKHIVVTETGKAPVQ